MSEEHSIQKITWRTYVNRLLVPVIILISFFVSQNHNGRVIQADAEGYYIYLPSIFIKGDFKDYPMLNCCSETKDGIIRTRYTYGVALLELPFFLLNHAYAKLTYVEKYKTPEEQKVLWKTIAPSGYSDIYGEGIRIAALFYALMGLLLLQQFLKKHFRDELVWLVLVCTYFGTNMYYYTVAEAGMSHIYSFFLFASMLHVVPRFLQKPGIKSALLFGLVFGLIVLIRPTNIILGLFLLLYNVYEKNELKERGRFLIRNYYWILFAGVIVILLFIPQTFYWKLAYESYLNWTYGDQGFSNWNAPKLLHVWFSHQNGMFVYSPVMLFAIPGFYFSIKEKKLNGPLFLGLFLVASYIFASWWTWWFGGAYGHRCFVEYYAFMALPMAFFFQRMFALKEVYWKVLIMILLCFLCYYSIKLSGQYIPPWDGDAWTLKAFGQQLKRLWRF